MEKIITPLPFFRAVEHILIFYVHVFKYIFPLVLVASFIQAIVPAITPENPTVGLSVSILAILALIFFYGWIICQADSVLLGEREALRESLHRVRKRYVNLIGTFFVYVVLGLILLLLMFSLHRLGELFNMTLVTTLISSAVILFAWILFFFAMPAVLLDNASIIKGFEMSTKMVWGNWWRTFAIMLCFAIPMILLSLGVVLLPRNIYLVSIYEFFYHLITYPLVVAITLVLFHDLKSRRQEKSFKKMSETTE